MYPLEGKDLAEITLPRDPQAGDFVPRVSDALATLERVEGRSQLEILLDLTYASADLIRIRRTIPEGRDGSISIEDGVALVGNARDLLFSAACSAVAPRSVFASRRPPQAIDYMHSARFGQTERGSYVVTIISRVEPLLTRGQQDLFEPLEDPFPRRVTRVLSAALHATVHASNAASTSGSFDAFREGVASGISANLCDAIVGMSAGESGAREIIASTSWAATRPNDSNPAPTTRFSPEIIPIIKEAARVFREMEPLEGVTIVGPVVNLHRNQGSASGIATVACVLEGRSRLLRVQLAERDYLETIRAHGEQRAITFDADVVRDGRALRAENVRELRLLEDGN
jgi:hypothetical protein